MRGRVLYVGRDPDLPAFLAAYGTGSFSVSALTPEGYRGEAADLLLWDLDDAPQSDAIPAGARVVTVGYRAGATLSRPFLYSDLEALLDPAGKTGTLVLSDAGRDLFSGAARVKLSPLEYDLCRALIDADGAVVPGADLARVGGRELSPRALCVAISSLRAKLKRLPVPPRIEAGRGEGYRLFPPAGN